MSNDSDINVQLERKETEILAPLTAEERAKEKRDLNMFASYLRGSTFAEIAKEFGVSVSTVCRTAKRDGWAQYAKTRRSRLVRQVLSEVVRSERIKNTDTQESPFGADAEETQEGWYWTMTIRTQSGVNPLGPIPPNPLFCRIVEENDEVGIFRIEYFEPRVPGAKPRWLENS
jgi:transposase